jgi:hypothetical protein
MKTKEDYKRAQRVVKEIIDCWDPDGLLSGGAPDDEYEDEIAAVVRRLPHIKTEDDAIRAVSMVMSAAFEAETFTPERCSAVGKLLFNRCREDGLI